MDQCKHVLFERTVWRVETMLVKSKQGDMTLILQGLTVICYIYGCIDHIVIQCLERGLEYFIRTVEQAYREETGNKTTERY